MASQTFSFYDPFLKSFFYVGPSGPQLGEAQGDKAPMNFSPSLEKCVGHSL